MPDMIEIRTDNKIFSRYLELLLTNAGYTVRVTSDIHGELPEYCGLVISSPGMLGEDKEISCPILIIGFRDEFGEDAAGACGDASNIRVGKKEYRRVLYRPLTDQELRDEVASALASPSALANKRRAHLPDRLYVDKSRHTASYGKKSVALTRREYALLELLVKKNGQAATLEEIEKIVWDNELAAGSNAAAVYVNYLRKKLETLTDKRLIYSVRGVGYRLVNG